MYEYITHIKTPTCFGTQVSYSGSYYKKKVYEPTCFIVISLIKTSVAKIHKMHKMYNIDVNNLEYFDNTLIVSRLVSCQVLT
jgi:hypothetical protein